jgi:hypothetical protein
MSLIVETGEIVAGAESYCTVAYATTYHAARGNAAWAALTTPQMEQALRRATDYMTQVYRKRWKGYVLQATQPLDWPRAAVFTRDYFVGQYLAPDNTVPDDVQRACAELALRASSADLAPDLERGVVREKIGPIETEYDRASPQAKRYRAVDDMLALYLLPSAAATVGLVRA